MPWGSIIGNWFRKDEGPRLDGDKVVLEVELRCPRGWKLDNLAKSEKGSFCWLQFKPADAPATDNPVVNGTLALPATPVEPAIVACMVPLETSAKARYLRIFVGRRTDITVNLPLPPKLGPESKEWCQWDSQLFLPQESKPVPPGYAVRYRVQGKSEYQKAHPPASVAMEAARAQALAAVPAGAPLLQWLPFFEDERGRPYTGSPGARPEVEAVKAYPAQLGPLLRSRDKNVVRQAVYAVAALPAIPATLIDALAAAGRRTIELIKEARAGALPNDPDLVAASRAYTYFFYWNQAMDHASAAKRRLVLEEIEREARSSPAAESDLHRLAIESRKALDSLNSSASG
jgi:hypothetical protein